MVEKAAIMVSNSVSMVSKSVIVTITDFWTRFTALGNIREKAASLVGKAASMVAKDAIFMITTFATMLASFLTVVSDFR